MRRQPQQQNEHDAKAKANFWRLALGLPMPEASPSAADLKIAAGGFGEGTSSRYDWGCSSDGEDGERSDGDPIIAAPSLNLREGAMMRSRPKGADPLQYYEIVRTLGAGSMGNVSLVRKKAKAIGGSARPHNISPINRRRALVEDSLRKITKQTPLSSSSSSPRPISTSSRSCCLFGRCLQVCAGKDERRHSSGLLDTKRTSTGTTEASSPTTSSGPGHRQQGKSTSIATLIKTKPNILIDVPQEEGTKVNKYHTTEGTTSTPLKHNQSSISNDSKYEMHYAMKSIHLNRLKDEVYRLELRNEVEILKSLDHPHIVRPIETFEHHRQLCTVMEVCEGGDLYSRDPYTEEQAARIVESVLSAVAFMHARGVVHRDLKYENIMFVSKSKRSIVKIIDFGLSKKYLPEQDVLKEGVGTLYSMAPEVIRGQYTSKADIWSIGVITYMLLSSHMPFYGPKRRIILQKILKCEYDFRGSKFRNVSDHSIRFIKNLLQFYPDDRPTAEEALRVPWLNLSSLASTRWPSPEQDSIISGEQAVMDSVQASIQTYASYNKLKKLALMVVAHKSTSDEIGFLRKAFMRYDTARDGAIARHEFKACLKGYGYSDKDLDLMFDACDIDGTGLIRYTEFLAATIEARGAINEERLAEAFDRLDSDDSGFISVKNLREILSEEFSTDDINQIIQEADLTADGRVSYEEFLSLWDNKEEKRREDALRNLVKQRYQRESVHELDSLSSSPKTKLHSDQKVVRFSVRTQ